MVLRQSLLMQCAWIERELGINGNSSGKFGRSVQGADPLLLRDLSDAEIARIADEVAKRLGDVTLTANGIVR
jgi:hypothetical protein